MGWILIQIPMDPELLPGSGIREFKAGSGFGINHSGSTVLEPVRYIKYSFLITGFR